MFQLRVATGQCRCHLPGWLEKDLSADRREAAAQERSQRRCIARSHLREHRVASQNQLQRFADQTPPGAGRSGAEHLDRHLEAVDQPATDGDQSGVVSVHTDIASMGSRPHHPGMVVEIGTFGQTSSADAVGEQHRIERSDQAARPSEPTQQVGLRRTPETVGSTGRHLAGVTVGEDERMAGELDHGVMVARHRLDDLDSPVDIREPPLGGVEQGAMKWVHDI